MKTIDLKANRRPNQVYRYLYYAACAAIMYGLFQFVRFMITGTPGHIRQPK